MSNAIGPGDWVECVDASPGSWTGQVHLTAGALYRIEAVVEAMNTRGRKGPALFLEGVSCLGTNGKRAAHRISRFRPIYRPKQSIIEALKVPPEGVAGLVSMDGEGDTQAMPEIADQTTIETHEVTQ